MSYPRIKALVPATEHFDETAMNGEGIWVSKAHFTAIENSLNDSAGAIELHDKAIDETNVKLKETTDALKIANDKVEAHEATIKGTNEKIVALEAEVARLGKKESGSGTTLVVKKDEVVVSEKKPSYLDDESPENKWFDKQAKYHKKTA